MPVEPTLVLDADLPKRLLPEIKRRGRAAKSAAELGVRKAKDPELLRALAAQFGSSPWVLVTGDDRMPAAHADVIAEVGATISTVDPRRPASYADREDAWKREIVHRWVHVMQTQQPGTIRRYSERGGRAWTPRRR